MMKMTSLQVKNNMNKQRCSWVSNDPIYQQYHDEEWGNLRNFQDDGYLFEMLTLEGAQAGLSWITILKRREAYRKAFEQFDPAKVATFQTTDIDRLMLNEGIIRNRRKIESAIHNATIFLQVQRQYGSFHAFLWKFIGRKQIVNQWQIQDEVPATTEESIRLSKTLKKLGFTFVGPVICYAYMQAIGLVNDHTADCFLSKEGGDIHNDNYDGCNNFTGKNDER